MPEGPEIHRVANKLAKALEGKKLQHVSFFYSPIMDQEILFLTKKWNMLGLNLSITHLSWR